MKYLKVIILIGMLFPLIANALTILGFNGQDNFGYGTWTSDSKNKKLVAIGVIDPKDRVGRVGGSYRVIYKLLPSPSYIGIWVDLSQLDISPFSKLSFWVRGDTKDYPEKIVVNFAGGSKEIEVTPEWKKIEIPLSELVKDKKAEQELSFIVDTAFTSNREGVFYIDEINIE